MKICWIKGRRSFQVAISMRSIKGNHLSSCYEEKETVNHMDNTKDSNYMIGDANSTPYTAIIGYISDNSLDFSIISEKRRYNLRKQ